MPAGKGEGAMRPLGGRGGQSPPGEAGGVEVSHNCWLGDLADLTANKKENQYCVLFLPLRKEIF